MANDLCVKLARLVHEADVGRVPLSMDDRRLLEASIDELRAREAESARLQERVRVLEGALRPLARIADMYERLRPGESAMINIDLCRRARTTLEAKTDG